MGRFLLRRLATGVFVLFTVVTVTFLLAAVVPSDPAEKWVGPHATAEQKAAARVELGLDKPLSVRYVTYLGNLLHGNLGISILSKRPVATELKEAIPNTLELVVWSVVVAFIIGLILGVYSATKENTAADHVARFFSVGVISMPTFWVGLMLQIIFSTTLHLLPLTGQMDTILKLTNPLARVTGLPILDSLLTGNWVVLGNLMSHFILPLITLSTYSLGLTARMTRSILLEVLNEDYIRAARAYGLKERKVIWGHAIKNVMGTVVTVLALSAGNALVNTFVIEAVFSWPGVGNYIARSVMNLDYPSIIGVTVMAAIAYVLLNLFADIVIAMDPRVRHAQGGGS